MNVYLAEFIGTAILILFGGGVCANVNLKRSLGQDSDWIVIARLGISRVNGRIRSW